MSLTSLVDDEFIHDSLSEHVEDQDCPEFKIQRYSVEDTIIEMNRSSHIFKPNPLVMYKGRTVTVSDTGRNIVSG